MKQINMKKMAGLLAILKLSLLIGISTPALAGKIPETAQNANHTSPLGTNTNEAIEVDSSLPFVDLFRFALPFEEARPWLTKGEIDYDENGWPTALNGGQAGTRFLNNIPADALPDGTYVVRYEGKGRLQYGGSAKVIKQSPGLDRIRLEPQKDNTITATLYIMQSDPKNPIRNIRVLMSGGICADNPFKRVDNKKQCHGQSYQAFSEHAEDILFNPDYLNYMKDFKVIRFMNMSGVTRNPLRHWKNRPQLTEATWGGKEGKRGVPVEIMVKLANQLNSNPWFNMPHNADDEYLRNFAQYVKQHLKPSLNTYIEYTNEAWNAVFVPQAEHMKQRGTIEKLDTDRRIAGFKYYSQQSVHIFKLWEEVFGDTDRLIRVMGGMTTDVAMTEIILAYQKAFRYIDALAIAPYFYIDQDKMGEVSGVDDVFELLKAKDNRYSIGNLMKIIRQQAETAQSFGVELIAYEGGQHLVDHKTHKLTEGATPHLIAANRDKRMAWAYRRLLDGWKAAGGQLFVAFSAPRPPTWHGSWGIKEYINQPDKETPKYRALMAFTNNEPCWWKGCDTNQLHRLPKPQYIPDALVTGKKAVAKLPAAVTIKKGNGKLSGVEPQHIARLIKGTLSNDKDLAATWQANWNVKYFNLRVDIHDDQLMTDSEQTWADDSVEVYLDTDNSRGNRFDGKNDFQIVFSMKDESVTINGQPPEQKTGKLLHNRTKTDNGYRLDIQIPWQVLQTKPKAGLKMGFDVHVNDDDNGRLRDAKMAWHAVADQAWKNPELFGEVVLGN